MSTRFATNALLALFGGFVVVASVAFRPAVTGWLGFAFGIGVILTVLLGQVDRTRAVFQRVIDFFLLALGALAMAFGIGASGSAQRWTVFAFALGSVGLGFVGLAAREISYWRTSHGLDQLHGLSETEERDISHRHQVAA